VKKLNWRTVVFGVGLALFIPVICYFILRSSGHTGHVIRPKHYAMDSIKTRVVEGKTIQDTVFHTIKDEVFISHLNDSVHIASDYPRKLLLINFFFTSCTTICPKMTYHMEMLQKGFKKRDTSMQLISISVDPKTDDVTTLRNYANTHSLDHDSWTFLTGDKTRIYDFARNELRLKLPDGTGSEDDFIHPNEFVLVDQYRNIRGYYNGLDSMDIKRCIDEMAVLMVEKNPKHERSNRH
jgi:protein SCO1